MPNIKKIRILAKFTFVFIVIFSWIFSGWPRIWKEPPFPPKIEEVKADSVGPNYASTSVQDSSIGNNSWTNPEYATSSDDNKASVALTKNTGISYYIKATGFGFSIPLSNQINGIVVEWERSDNLDGGAGETQDNAVRIVKGGVIGATDKSKPDNWTTTDTFITYGSSTDLWGDTWTAADINSSNFGAAISNKNVKISGGGAATTGYVDSVRITVYYTPNQPPSVTNVKLNAGNNIDLTENTTKAVSATATVSDQNGYSDITSVTCRTYRSGVTSTENCTLDDNNCYQVTGSTSSCSGNDCTATCNFSVWFIAEPTDTGSPWAAQHWVAWIKAIDSQNASSSATNTAQTIEMNTLNALDVTASTSYGSLSPGQKNDPLDKLLIATTTGNSAIDANVSSTNLCTDYPTCSGNTIAVGQQHYATSSGVAYASGTVASTTSQLLEFTTGKPTAHPSNQAQNTYWGISIPLGTPIGTYKGEITYSVTPD